MWVIKDDEFLGDVPTWDRAQQFGDGLFETIPVRQGVPVALELHTRRLNLGLSRIGIKIRQDVKCLLEDLVTRLVHESQLESGIFKCIISRGASPRGYRYDTKIEPSILSFYGESPKFHEQFYSDGIKLKLCSTTASLNPSLAGIKHLNRLENVLAAAELCDVEEGLMLSPCGLVVEGTMSNVFIEENQQLITPRLERFGVSGVMRARIELYCEKHGISFNESDITLDRIEQASSIFVCNSVIGIWPVSVFNTTHKPLGLLTKELVRNWQLGKL